MIPSRSFKNNFGWCVRDRSCMYLMLQVR